MFLKPVRALGTSVGMHHLLFDRGELPTFDLPPPLSTFLLHVTLTWIRRGTYEPEDEILLETALFFSYVMNRRVLFPI